VFGPRPRDYRFKLNKKVKQLARRSALTYKAQDDQIKIVENFTFEAPKTKDFVKFAKNLETEGKKILLVLATRDKNVNLSARNIPNVQVITAKDIHTYAIMHSNAVIMTEDSLEVINNF
ncbi:MAG: 50S ribosomal protein L4, partial [Paramuribaculum sp.]|nr:50S ribosomal protein L4 [Paramuribaculum sp.]